MLHFKVKKILWIAYYTYMMHILNVLLIIYLVRLAVGVIQKNEKYTKTFLFRCWSFAT